MTEKSGLPVNVNPFSVNIDECICDGAKESIAPQYFKEIGHDSSQQNCHACHAPVEIEIPPLSQKDAEKLVRKVHDVDVVYGSFAVKEEYAHIIPHDLKQHVLITINKKDQCVRSDCHYFNQKICPTCKRTYPK